MTYLFKQYKRKSIAEIRYYMDGEKLPTTVSISDADKKNGSPKAGDMIARNPANHNDQWLIAKDYFDANFEEFASQQQSDAVEVLEDLKRELHAKGLIEAMDIVYDKITLLNKQSKQQSDAVPTKWDDVLLEYANDDNAGSEDIIDWLIRNYKSPTKK